ncbi:MAG: type II toxin-antitoxin system RelE/ParE family toxin [Bacteroidota bacterium]
MEKEPKPVIYSIQFKQDVIDVYKYSIETFGKIHAENYLDNIYRLVDNLYAIYDIYPECRHLPTKSRMYRWIILDSHLIIYRITATEIQVLRIVHSHRSISKIKASREVKL